MFFPRVAERLVSQRGESAADTATCRVRQDHLVDEPAFGGPERVGKIDSQDEIAELAYEFDALLDLLQQQLGCCVCQRGEQHRRVQLLEPQLR